MIFCLILCGLISILYFINLNGIGIMDKDEARYVETAREMIELNDFITPYFNYQLHLEKPILIYWAQALSMKLFGINEFAARLPITLSGLLTVFLVYIFCLTVFNEYIAIISTLVLLTSLIFCALSRVSTPDMLLTLGSTGAILSFFLGYTQILNSHKKFKFQIETFSIWYLIAFLFLGIAFLAKGPLGILIPGIVLFPLFWWTRKLEYFYKNISFWAGSILFIIISSPWYIAVHKATEGQFTKSFFWEDNLSRYTSTLSGHDAPFFFYIPVVLVGFLPWSFFLIQATVSLIKRGMHRLSDSVTLQAHWLSLWWAVIVFIFFTVSRTKLFTYILPLVPAMAILVSIWLWDLLNNKENKAGLTWGTGVFFFIAVIITLICLFGFDTILIRELKGFKIDFISLILLFILLIGTGMSYASSNKQVHLTFYILMSTTFLFYSLIAIVFLPKADQYIFKPSRIFVLSLPKDTTIGRFESVKPSFNFYAKKKILDIESIKELNTLIIEEPKFAFTIKKNVFEKCKSKLNTNNLYLAGEDNRNAFYTNFEIKSGLLKE